MHIEARMTVPDAYNSAGMLVDAIRAVFVAKMQGMSGVLPAACAYFMKSPPKQMQPDEAKRAMLEEIRA